MTVRAHNFRAIAFIENFVLRDLTAAFPSGRLTAQDLHVDLPDGADLWLYPFGAIVFHDASSARRTTSRYQREKSSD